jgi:rRNA maturation RNase YbeY
MPRHVVLQGARAAAQGARWRAALAGAWLDAHAAVDVAMRLQARRDGAEAAAGAAAGRAALLAFPAQRQGLLNLTFLDDAEMAELNKQSRGVAAPTDVLSFLPAVPPDDAADEELEHEAAEQGITMRDRELLSEKDLAEMAALIAQEERGGDTFRSFDDGSGPRPVVAEHEAQAEGDGGEALLRVSAEADAMELGDLVISLDTAERQALERGTPLEDEVRILLVHGLLHLLGNDHESAAELAAMAQAEREVMEALQWRGQGLCEMVQEEERADAGAGTQAR